MITWIGIGIAIISLLVISVYFKLLPRKLNHPDWKVRVKAIKELASFFLWWPETDQIVDLLLQAGEDTDWRVRQEAVSLIEKHLDALTNRRVQRSRPVIYSTIIRELVRFLGDEQPRIRKTAVALLSKLKDIRIIEPLIQTLRDTEEEGCSEEVGVVWQSTNTLVHTVVFGAQEEKGYDSRHTVYDLDVSHLMLPLTQLHTIDIFVETCDRSQIQLFGRYISTYLAPQHLKEYVIVHIYGNIGRFPLPLYNPFNRCKQVETSIETVLFHTEPTHQYPPLTTLKNPDMSGCTVFLDHLKQIMIHTMTCDLRQVEVFGEYLTNMASHHKDYLNKHVSVSIYGNLGSCPLSVYNSFNHCHQVEVYIDTILFGTAIEHEHNPVTTLINPDVSAFMLPLPHLQHIVIHTATYDFHHIERFLTYAVNYIGQKHLKQYVDVYLYGESEQLHPNLRNNLTNLCNRVYVHKEDDISILMN